MPPAFVRPYVRRNKTDRTDAEAILEAVRSGELPRVPVKRVEQQALVALVMRLRTIPGIGRLTATAFVGSVGHIHAFRRARQFASWLGLTPREYSSGQRRRLGGISKRGDVYLRCLLTHGARGPTGAGRPRSPSRVCTTGR